MSFEIYGEYCPHLEPNNSDFVLTLAQFYMEKKSVDAAKQLIDQVLMSNPRHEMALKMKEEALKAEQQVSDRY